MSASTSSLGALLEGTGLPIVTLPALPQGVDSGSVHELAGLLAEQGIAS